jgi:hypothetical protein
VVGATVVVNGLSTSPPTTVTDADGRFAFVEVPPWPSYWITVTPPFGSGLVRYTQSLAVVDPDEIIELDITMDAAARIEISVTADGEPAESRAILYRETDPFGPPAASASTDESGRIVLADLQPGRYVLELESSDARLRRRVLPGLLVLRRRQCDRDRGGRRHRARRRPRTQRHDQRRRHRPRRRAARGSDRGRRHAGSRGDLGREAGSRASSIDDDDPPGTYRRGCVHPSAQYYVWIWERPGVHAAQYFDRATTPADATPVTVVEGADTSGIDFHLEPSAPQVAVRGLSRQFFRAGTTTTGVRLYGDNFPTDPAALVAEVTRFGFDDVFVDIDVTAMLSPQIAVVTVTVADAPGAWFGPRPLQLGRAGSSLRVFCDDCLFVGSPETSRSARCRVASPPRPGPRCPSPRWCSPDPMGTTDRERRPDGRWLATGPHARCAPGHVPRDDPVGR